VLYEDGVALLPVELPVRLVGERDGPELSPDIHGHLVGWLGEGEPLRVDETDGSVRQMRFHGGHDTKDPFENAHRDGWQSKMEIEMEEIDMEVDWRRYLG